MARRRRMRRRSRSLMLPELPKRPPSPRIPATSPAGAPERKRRLNGRLGAALGGAAAPHGPLLLDEIDQHIVTEGLGGGEERPTAVHLGQLLDEVLQIAVGVEHE